MKSLKDRVTPSIVISSLALFVALGGASYAALGANSVGSKQLKKNAVVTAKIKNNAVTTSKVKNDAITGAKVKESSLGTVPRATLADAATSATTATTATNATSATTAENAAKVAGYVALERVTVQSTASNPSTLAAQAAATEVPLFDLGSIKVYGKCYTSSGTLYASHYIRTTVNGAIFDSAYDQAYGNPAYLDTGTPESDREIYYVATGMNSMSYYSAPDPTYVMTAGGEAWFVSTQVFSKQGTLPGGDGPYGAGNNCVYSGYAIKA